MSKIWETIKSYFWWTHSRGSLHYDVMVTLILLFIFVTPYFVDYKDKPAERKPRDGSVLVMPDGENNLILRVDARDVKATAPAEIQAELQKIITPISGAVTIKRWAPEQDLGGHLVGYHVWVRR
ncbi:MAG: hypothetical protein P4M01_01180 [Acidobacteriota bacterium]|nr:hypothetical protein [Acidobacteriota bacterium]